MCREKFALEADCLPLSISKNRIRVHATYTGQNAKRSIKKDRLVFFFYYYVVRIVTNTNRLAYGGNATEFVSQRRLNYGALHLIITPGNQDNWPPALEIFVLTHPCYECEKAHARIQGPHDAFVRQHSHIIWISFRWACMPFPPFRDNPTVNGIVLMTSFSDYNEQENTWYEPIFLIVLDDAQASYRYSTYKSGEKKRRHYSSMRFLTPTAKLTGSGARWLVLQCVISTAVSVGWWELSRTSLRWLKMEGNSKQAQKDKLKEQWILALSSHQPLRPHPLMFTLVGTCLLQ